MLNFLFFFNYKRFNARKHLIPVTSEDILCVILRFILFQTSQTSDQRAAKAALANTLRKFVDLVTYVDLSPIICKGVTAGESFFFCKSRRCRKRNCRYRTLTAPNSSDFGIYLFNSSKWLNFLTKMSQLKLCVKFLLILCDINPVAF